MPTCPVCGGSGYDPEDSGQCWRCFGEGDVYPDSDDD
jgi:DnaJ-class molecular chaperone